MERHTLFVQMSPDLYQNESLCSSRSTLNRTTNGATLVPEQSKGKNRGQSSGSGHFVKEGDVQESIDISTSKAPLLSEIFIRRERQTFTRLPTSNAILFTVRTYMKPLTSLGDEELAAFVEQAEHWGDDIATYKGREQWWGTVLRYHAARKDGLTGGN
jgi:Protein of unknown function (DUF3445)